MASTQTKEFTKVPNELLEAILATNFTKRQQKIILMILRLSYGCGKEYALLRPSDFTVAGVHKNNIKKELQQLAAAGVITVEGKHITLNKNHLDWQLSPIDSGNRFREILHRNLANKTRTGMAAGANKTRTNESTKQEPAGKQNINPKVAKSLADSTLQPNCPLGQGGAERNLKKIKESIKKDPHPYDPDFLRFWDLYPRQLDKFRAFPCWQARLNEGVAARDMVDAAANYAVYCRKHNILERYIKYPANFLSPDLYFRDWTDREDAKNELAREKKKELIRSLYSG